MNIFKGIIFLILLQNASANPIVNNEDVVLSFERIEIPMLIELVYSDVLKTSYIIHDDVLKKINNVTIRLKSKHKKSDMPAIMTDLLNEYGISIEKKPNHILFKLTENKIEPKVPVFYKPKYRTTTYLISMLAGTIDMQDSVGQKRPNETKKDNKSEEGMNKLVDKNSDGILIMATQKKLTLIMSLLKELDVPEKQIHIQALVYEVSSGNNESNAIQAVLKTIGSLGINLSIGASRGAGQLFEVTTKDLNVLMNVFNRVVVYGKNNELECV
jgi:general secretion pathway protein D